MKDIKYLFLLLILSFLLISCNKNPSGNKNSDLTGNITFLTATGDSYEANVTATIKLYHSNQAVDSLNTYKSDYPFVGSSINPLLSLDHRTLGESAYTTQTTSNGDFTLKKISNGEYLLVYSSDNFGWHTKVLTIDHNLEINLSMREKYSLSSSINGNTIIGPDAFIEISSNVNIANGVELKILENTIIGINDSKISVIGSLNINGSITKPIIFTSLADLPQKADWKEIYLANNSTSFIKNAVFQWASKALNCASTSNIENIIITNSKANAIYCNASTITIANTTFYGNYQDCYFSASNDLSAQSTINKSLFINTLHTAIDLYTSSPTIKNSIFLNSENHINAEYNSYISIENCNFDISSSYSLTTSKEYDYTGNILISKCTFTNNNGLIYAYRGATINASYNNFLCSDGYIFRLIYYYGGTQVTAQRNWWGTSNESEIQDLIWDKNDDSSNGNPGEVDYSRWKSDKVSGTGPVNN